MKIVHGFVIGLSVLLFGGCENGQEVVPQTGALAYLDSTSLENKNHKIRTNSKAFDEFDISFRYGDNIVGNVEQPESFGEFDTFEERFVRLNSAGAYSFQSAVSRTLDPGNGNEYRYRLGFRIVASILEGDNNAAFALPTTTPDVNRAPSPDRDVISDAALEQAGLRRLYAFVGNNGRDFVFAAGQEAQNLLQVGSGYVNVSRGSGIFDPSGPFSARTSNIAEDLGTPKSTDLLIFINGNEPNTAPLFRYRNPKLGTHVHLVGSNNPEAQAFIDAGFMKEEPPLGYAYKK